MGLRGAPVRVALLGAGRAHALACLDAACGRRATASRAGAGWACTAAAATGTPVAVGALAEREARPGLGFDTGGGMA